MRTEGQRWSNSPLPSTSCFSSEPGQVAGGMLSLEFITSVDSNILLGGGGGGGDMFFVGVSY